MRILVYILIFVFGSLLTVETWSQTGIDYSLVAEDINIMAKVIEKVMQEKFRDQYGMFGGVFFDGSPIPRCSGFYLPNFGAIFITNVNFPVMMMDIQKIVDKSVQSKEPPQEDIWEIARQELHGIQRPPQLEAEVAIDPVREDNAKRIEQLKRELIQVIGTYAHRIRQMNPNESVIITVQGTSARLPEKALRLLFPEFEPEELQSRPELDPVLQQRMAYVASSGIVLPKRGIRTTMIVRAYVKDIVAYKEGRIGFDQFANKVEIVQY